MRRVAATPSSEQISDYTGSGPFVFRKDLWEPGTKIVYDKFTGYVPRPEPAGTHRAGWPWAAKVTSNGRAAPPLSAQASCHRRLSIWRMSA